MHQVHTSEPTSKLQTLDKNSKKKIKIKIKIKKNKKKP